MKKQNVKNILIEVAKVIFEFLIFRWGKSYARVNKLCTGDCSDNADDILERSKSTLERANKNVGRILEDAEEIKRRYFSEDKKE